MCTGCGVAEFLLAVDDQWAGPDRVAAFGERGAGEYRQRADRLGYEACSRATMAFGTSLGSSTRPGLMSERGPGRPVPIVCGCHAAPFLRRRGHRLKAPREGAPRR